jgi:hypothetical protein
MKPTSLIVAAALLFSLVTLSASHAADCAGPWQRGPTCQKMGLDTHQGTCRPGDVYETLCDDSPQGFRICQGTRRCGSGSTGDCRLWDFASNQPCPSGYVNADCQGYCEPQSGGGGNDCQTWDFAYNRHCPNGYRNYDCQGGCEPASFFGR